ncbi:acyltransferase family-domain-containing protein [Ilyonectria destructans]|nr:acyltransferase family-domain-containing protein [Ilyonectria destructans]
MNDPTHSSLASEESVGLLIDPSQSDSILDKSIYPTQRFSVATWASKLLSPVFYIRSTHWRVLIVRLAWFFVPSFLQGRSMREQIRPAKLGPTAYLDGMRGMAALFVFHCHYSYSTFAIANGWGFNGGHYEIVRLPFIKLFYAGPAAVCVFFVISGYALSYRPIKNIRSGNVKDFSTGLSSMVFRRAIRLFLPTTISTFMVVCLIRMGVFEWTRAFAMNPTYLRKVREVHPKMLSTAHEQWVQWAGAIFGGFKVFSWEHYGGFRIYDAHLWTIPVEFRCSLYLFLVILGTARLRTQYRFLTLAVVTYVTYYNSRWEFLLFLSGMALVEWDHIRGAHIPPPALPSEEREKESKPAHSTTKLVFWNLVAIIGLYFLSQPDSGGSKTPGWVYLTSLIPEWWAHEGFRYWQGFGAAVFVLGVGHSAWWQRVFNSSIAQYFGKISYALYLMHGPVLKVIGMHWMKWAWGVTGIEGEWYTAGFFLGACFCIPAVIWCADIFWRAVDIPSVKFARWFENKLIKTD